MVRTDAQSGTSSKDATAATQNGQPYGAHLVADSEQIETQVDGYMLWTVRNNVVDIKASGHLQPIVDSDATLRLRQQLQDRHKSLSEAARSYTFPGHQQTLAGAIERGAPSTPACTPGISPATGSHRTGEDQAHQALHQPVTQLRMPAARLDTCNPQGIKSEPSTTRSRRKRARQIQTHRLLISDGPKVKEFIAGRLKRMQQNAVKRLAKAWIRGICPKKQAKFPYQNHKRGVPGWWPSHDVCPFIEPDHIKKKERLALCQYLLTLRPTPEVLRVWNFDKVEPHITHITRGWTAFLMESAPPSMLCELREPDRVMQRRQRLLEQLYEVARLEEDFHMGGIDASYEYQWQEEDGKFGSNRGKETTRARRSAGSKRPRQDSFASDSDSESSMSASSVNQSKKFKSECDDQSYLHTSNSFSTPGNVKQSIDEASLTTAQEQTICTVRPAPGPSQKPRAEDHPEQDGKRRSRMEPPASPDQLHPTARFVNDQPRPTTTVDEKINWAFPNGLPTGEIWPYYDSPLASFSSSASGTRSHMSHSFTMDDHPIAQPMCMHPYFPGPDQKPSEDQVNHGLDAPPSPSMLQPYYDTVPNSPVLPETFAMQMNHQLPFQTDITQLWGFNGHPLNHHHTFMPPTSANSHSTGLGGPHTAVNNLHDSMAPTNYQQPELAAHPAFPYGNGYMTESFPSGVALPPTGSHLERQDSGNPFIAYPQFSG